MRFAAGFRFFEKTALAATAALAVGCTAKNDGASVLRLRFEAPPAGAQKASAQSFPTDRRICFAVNVSAEDIAPKQADPCSPTLGVYAGFAEAGKDLSLTVGKGSKRTIEIFAYFLEAGSVLDCPSWSDEKAVAGLDYTRVYQIGKSDPVDFTKDEETVQIQASFPGFNSHLAALRSLPTSCPKPSDPRNTGPTVELATNLTSPTNSSSVPVTITFSESVSDFNPSKLVLTNATVSGFTGTGAKYSVNLTPSSEGSFSLFVPANVARSTSGSGNQSSTQLTLVSDRTPPPAPTGLALQIPNYTPANVATPTIRVGGVTAGDTVRLFADPTCSVERASGVASSNWVDLTSSQLMTSATYFFYARSVDPAGNVSPCSPQSSRVEYQLDLSPAPTVMSVLSPTMNGLYGTDSTVLIHLKFTQAVTVSGGAPTLRLNASASERVASYVSGSNSDTLAFSYTVQAGDASDDLDVFSTTALSLNGATIQGPTRLNAELTLPSPGSVGSLGTNKDLKIDGVAPSAPTVFSLVSPLTSPGRISTPIIGVSGVASGETVRLFSDSGCSILRGTAVSAGGTTSVTSSALATDGLYSFYAQAMDAANNTSPCSSMSVSYFLDTSPPGFFVITGATGISDSVADTVLAGSTTVTANWTASSDASSYEVRIRNSAGTADVCGPVTVTGLNHPFAACTLVDGVSYKISVKAFDLAGNTAAPSNDGFAFTVHTTLPSSFPIVGVQGGTDIIADSFLTSGQFATVVWADASHETGYTVSIRDASNNSNICGPVDVAANTTSHAFSSCALNEGSSYRIRVIAKNLAGTTSASNNDLSFTVDTTAPLMANAFSLFDPAASPSFDATPTLQVLGVNVGDTVELFTDATCSARVGGAVATASEVMVTTDLLAEGHYQFRTRVTDAAGNKGPCSTALVAYEVDSTAPGLFPILGVTGGRDNTQDSWLTGGFVPTIWYGVSTDAVRYEVRIRNASNTADVCGPETSVSTSHPFMTCLLLEGESYGVVVKSFDLAGQAQFGTQNPFMFRVDTLPPSPPNGFDDGGNTPSLTTAPTFSWSSSFDGGSGLARYEVAIGTTPGGTQVRGWTNVGLVLTIAQSGLSLESGQTYYGSIRAIDVAGNVSAVVVGDGFTAPNLGSLGAFEILGVTAGTEDTSRDAFLTAGTTTDPTVHWKPSQNATGYDVAIRFNGSDVCGMTSVAPTSTSVSLTGCGLGLNTSYEISVIAKGSGGVTRPAANHLYRFTVLNPYPLASIRGVSGGSDVDIDAYAETLTNPRIHWTPAGGATGWDASILDADSMAVVCGPFVNLSAASDSFTFSGCNLAANKRYLVDLKVRPIAGPPVFNAVNSPFAFHTFANQVVTACVSGGVPASTVTTTALGGFILDSGGGGNYGNNESCFVQVAPPGVNRLRLNASEFGAADLGDVLEIHSAPPANLDATTLRETYSSGSQSPQDLLVNSATTTLYWRSNATQTAAGFKIRYRAQIAPSDFQIIGVSGGSSDMTPDSFLEDGLPNITVSWSPSVGANTFDIVVRDFNNRTTICDTSVSNVTTASFACPGLENSRSYRLRVLARGAPDFSTPALNDGMFFSVGPRPVLGPNAYIKSSNRLSAHRFGSNVAISGNTMVVGVPAENGDQTTITNGPSAPGIGTSVLNSGAVYVYLRTQNGWQQQAYLKASNAKAGARFGESVAIDGNTIIVGAPGEQSSNLAIVNGVAISDNTSTAGSGAAYVFVRAGSTWSQQAYLKAPNGSAGDGFGSSVAVNQNTVVIGAPQEASALSSIVNEPAIIASNSTATSAGAAYVFVRDTMTSQWSHQAYLKAPNAHAGARFGHAVGIMGNFVVVGAPNEKNPISRLVQSFLGGLIDTSVTGSDVGAAYVFQRSSNTWSMNAYLKAPNAEDGDLFGHSVAISSSLFGTTIAIGAIGEDSNQVTITNGPTASSNNSSPGSGAVYVFTRSLSGWQQQAYVKAPNTEPNGTNGSDFFGQSISLDNDILVVGAPYEDSPQKVVSNGSSASAENSLQDSGAAYVFTRSGLAWQASTYLKAANSAPFDQFGSAVGVSGLTVVVGAPREDSDGNSIVNGMMNYPANSNLLDSGASYIFAPY